MDWVKLSTSFHNDAAIARAGEPAEVLFIRAMSYCGDQENGGLVEKEILPRLCPVRGAARARALVKEGLWEVVDGGWRFVSWDRHQTTRDQLAAQREAGRTRQAKHRQKASRNAVTDGVSDAHVTGREVEGEVDAAAAAARGAPLPASVEILRAALEAHKLVVRWDLLDHSQVEEVARLVEEHGDAPLVRSALASYQPNRPPATAQAWIGGWQQLRKPGDLAAVKAVPCTEPGHSGTVRHCTQCAAERLAGGDR